MIVLLFILSWAKAVEVSLEVNREIYVGVPFVLTVVVSDVEENPQPELELPEIPGAEVDFLVCLLLFPLRSASSMAVEAWLKDVNFAFRYQVTANKTGAAAIAPIKGSQAEFPFSGRGGRFVAQDVPSTKDLGIEVVYPERPFRVGETVPVEVHLFFKKGPQRAHFCYPFV